MLCLALIWHPTKLCLHCHRETCNPVFVCVLECVWAHAELIASAKHHLRLKYLCLYDDTWVSERCQIPNQCLLPWGLPVTSLQYYSFWQVVFQKLTNARGSEKLGDEKTPLLSKEAVSGWPLSWHVLDQLSANTRNKKAGPSAVENQ